MVVVLLQRRQGQLLLVLVLVLVLRRGPWAELLLDTLDLLNQLLELATLTHALVGLVDDTAQFKLAAALARLAWHGARIAFDL